MFRYYVSVKNLMYSVKIHETQCSLCLANIKPCIDLYKFLLGKIGYRKKELKLWKIANKEHIFWCSTTLYWWIRRFTSGMAAHASNPSTWEVETEESGVDGQPCYITSLRSARLCWDPVSKSQETQVWEGGHCWAFVRIICYNKLIRSWSHEMSWKGNKKIGH